MRWKNERGGRELDDGGCSGIDGGLCRRWWQRGGRSHEGLELLVIFWIEEYREGLLLGWNRREGGMVFEEFHVARRKGPR